MFYLMMYSKIILYYPHNKYYNFQVKKKLFYIQKKIITAALVNLNFFNRLVSVVVDGLGLLLEINISRLLIVTNCSLFQYFLRLNIFFFVTVRRIKVLSLFFY